MSCVFVPSLQPLSLPDNPLQTGSNSTTGGGTAGGGTTGGTSTPPAAFSCSSLPSNWAQDSDNSNGAWSAMSADSFTPAMAADLVQRIGDIQQRRTIPGWTSCASPETSAVGCTQVGPCADSVGAARDTEGRRRACCCSSLPVWRTTTEFLKHSVIRPTRPSLCLQPAGGGQNYAVQANVTCNGVTLGMAGLINTYSTFTNVRPLGEPLPTATNRPSCPGFAGHHPTCSPLCRSPAAAGRRRHPVCGQQRRHHVRLLQPCHLVPA